MTNKPNDTITILAGGKQVDVAYLDGKTETALVRKIPIRELHELGKAWGKEGEEIDLYCDKPEGWSATLTDESYEQVIETGRELNAGPFERWYARQQQALKMAGINLQDVVEKAASSVLQKSTSS
jgi:hypothetical protein